MMKMGEEKRKRRNLAGGVGGAGHAWVRLRNGRERGESFYGECDEDVDERDKVERPRPYIYLYNYIYYLYIHIHIYIYIYIPPLPFFLSYSFPIYFLNIFSFSNLVKLLLFFRRVLS